MIDCTMMIFYPSGENSGGQIDIYHSNYIQRIIIFSNGKTKMKLSVIKKALV